MRKLKDVKRKKSSISIGDAIEKINKETKKKRNFKRIFMLKMKERREVAPD